MGRWFCFLLHTDWPTKPISHPHARPINMATIYCQYSQYPNFWVYPGIPLTPKVRTLAPQSHMYVGFIWSLDQSSVSLLCKKCLKYLAKVSAFLSLVNKKVMCKEYQSVHGTFQHITFLYGNGHSFLAPFSTFLPKFLNDYMHHHVLKPVLESLHWWQAILSKLCSSRSLTPRCSVDPNL